MKKKLILIVFTLSFVCSAYSQSYLEICGVTEINTSTPEQFDCLLMKANKLSKTGLTLFAVGTSIMAFSGIMWARNPYSWTIPAVFIGIPVGGLLDIIGLPCLVTGLTRQNKLMNTPYYKSQNVGAFNLTPTILRNQIKNTYSVGLTASISF